MPDVSFTNLWVIALVAVAFAVPLALGFAVLAENAIHAHLAFRLAGT